MRARRLRLLATLIILGLGIVCLAGAGIMITTDVRGSLSLPELIYLRLWLAAHEEALQTPAGTDAEPVIFVINTGDSAASIAQNLAAQGLITDPDLFRNYARYHGLDSELEAGTYFLRSTQTIPEIAQALTDSSTASVTVQIIEGWRREEIAAAIDNNPLLSFDGADFLAATGIGVAPPDFMAYVSLPAEATLEGFLYPDTYYVPPDASAADFRDTLLRTFQERVEPSLQLAAANQGFSLYQVVTLASIVQREAVHAEEQPLIASVYLNRLAIGMKLDADPTVQYSIGYRDGTWWPSITAEEYSTTQSPYNTYLYSGLPPGPIANPSLSALRAVIFPAESNYYYFRADCEGSGYHVFAVTFEEHVANGNCP